jgi:hypothetical protein
VFPKTVEQFGRHSGASWRDPESSKVKNLWMPAFAGMTVGELRIIFRIFNFRRRP